MVILLATGTGLATQPTRTMPHSEQGKLPGAADDLLPLGRGGAVMQLLHHVHNTLQASSYHAVTRVDVDAGSYQFDCSGMAAWVLKRTAPVAHASVVARSRNGRPLARDYYRQIAAAGRRKVAGWTHVGRVGDARPGDVIAWLKPKWRRSAMTGHVAFLVSAPEGVPDMPGAYLVRVADASRYTHQDDTRTGTGRNGFGMGTILVLAHPETDAPVAYGWHGKRSRWLPVTDIAIGRAER